MRDSEVSPRFLGRRGHINHWVTQVEWTNDGSHWFPAKLVSGSVTRSLSDQIHWKASLSLAGVELGLDAFNPFNTRLRIRHGLGFGPGDFELIPFGVFRVQSASRDLVDGTVEVEAVSYESFIINAKLVKPHRYQGATADAIISAIVETTMGDAASVRWDPRIIDKHDTKFPPVMVEQERWDLIDGQESSGSIAAAIGGRVIADADGGFVVIPVPTLEDAAVADIDPGPGGMLVNSTTELSADDVFNTVVADGSSVEGVAVRAIVEDKDPLSPTYVYRPVSQGGFGRAVYFYSSPLLDTQAKAYDAARAKLAERLGMRQQVTLDQPHWPLFEPGDVVRVNGAAVILDSVTYDLLGGPLQAETRTQRATFAGDFWSEPDETDGTADEGAQELFSA